VQSHTLSPAATAALVGLCVELVDLAPERLKGFKDFNGRGYIKRFFLKVVAGYTFLINT